MWFCMTATKSIIFVIINLHFIINRAQTCSRPSRVLWMVTHLLGWTPLVVMAVMRESSSSFFSFSFFTKLSMARLAKPSFSPPCRWHIRLWTMLKHASLLLGELTDILGSYSKGERQRRDKWMILRFTRQACHYLSFFIIILVLIFC